MWAVFATCLTAVIVCLLDWSRLWWLIPVAVLSYLLALVGYVAVRRGWPSWVGAHGLGGSPAAIGVPLIVRTHTGTRAERPMPRVL